MTSLRKQNFDPIARSYQWLEYLTLGTYLERCRYHFLDELKNRRHALVLGDGDGRFTATLLATNLEVIVDAVDSSARMLALLRSRVSRLGPSFEKRLQTHHIDALDFIPTEAAAGQPYDLIVTHFFLDCLTDNDLAALVTEIAPELARNALWVVSEFAIPTRQPMAFFSHLIVSTLYKIFSFLTGLAVKRLPDYAAALKHSGFSLSKEQSRLSGLLVSQLWKDTRDKPGTI